MSNRAASQEILESPTRANPNPAEMIERQGVVQFQRREFAPALGAFDKSLNLYRQAHNSKGEGQALIRIAMSYEALGQRHRSLDYLFLALAVQRQTGDK
jgi:tetratricopeptide (TPR) repeat protein